MYATGELVGPLKRNGTCKTLWNSDSFDYTERTPSLYQSHPFVLGVRPDGTAVGVIAETTRRCEIDLKRDILFRVQGPAPAITVIERESPLLVVRELARMTGRMAMPPLWALGFHQSRWSYEPDSRVLEIAREFRSRSIPCDAIWLDIDYMRGFRCFTFDPEKFGTPRAMCDQLHATGFRVVCMIDPGLKVDPEYQVYADGVRGDQYIKDADGREYHGKVWPGECAFPDFTRARTREWWASLYPDLLSVGIDGVWNDMNEPAVFDVPTKTMPEDNHHDADHQLGGPDAHARYHNIYGMQMVRATLEGIREATPEKRPFVLTRANFLGGQRYAATWSGDNRSDWNHLRWCISTTINLGLSGQPLSGPDIGGFIGDATAELFARFMGIGSLLPFARCHSNKGSIDHEPWAFGPECESICRQALSRRYALLPYLYLLARRAFLAGDPMVQPIFFAAPQDLRLRGAASSFLLGESVLVRCCTQPVLQDCPDPMPPGRWKPFDLIDGADASLPRLYLKEGHAVPVAGASQNSEDVLNQEWSLLAAVGREPARGHVYRDVGDGWGFEAGEFSLAEYEVDGAGVRVRVLEGLGAAPLLSVRRV
jgi:alpha-glucosidase